MSPLAKTESKPNLAEVSAALVRLLKVGPYKLGVMVSAEHGGALPAQSSCLAELLHCLLGHSWHSQLGQILGFFHTTSILMNTGR